MLFRLLNPNSEPWHILVLAQSENSVAWRLKWSHFVLHGVCRLCPGSFAAVAVWNRAPDAACFPVDKLNGGTQPPAWRRAHHGCVHSAVSCPSPLWELCHPVLLSVIKCLGWEVHWCTTVNKMNISWFNYCWFNRHTRVQLWVGLGLDLQEMSGTVESERNTAVFCAFQSFAHKTVGRWEDNLCVCICVCLGKNPLYCDLFRGSSMQHCHTCRKPSIIVDI